MTYKGYEGRSEFDPVTGFHHGRVAGLRDVVTFVGRTPDELDEAFRGSVDDYLAFCEERGEAPDVAQRGSTPQLDR